MSVEERYLRLEAYATSPHGLAISRGRFWSLSRREWNALLRVREAEMHRESCLYAQLQTSICNGLLPRVDKQRWEPRHFYAGYPPEESQPQTQLQPRSVEEEKARWRSMLGGAAKRKQKTARQPA